MLSSIETQIPFTYGYLDLCNEDGPEPNETFTELLSGTRAQYTNYVFNMNHNETCIASCVKEFKDYEVDDYIWLINRNYYINFYLDSLRAGRSKTQSHINKTYTSYISGIPIGFFDDGVYYI
jgi:hypothetical protein